METEEQPVTPEKKVLRVEDLDVEFLPIVYDIIKSIDKDNHHDNSAKTRESQDCSQKVFELQKKLDQTRAEIQLLPGIEYSKEQQLNHLEALKTQLRLKQELLQKYRYMLLANNEHLVQRLSESYPMRKIAQIVVRGVLSGRNIIEENKLHEKLTPEQFRMLMQEIATKFQKQIKQVQDTVKKREK